jgi:hypothetical protein
MAGRPKTMAKKVRQLEQMALDLCLAVNEICPAYALEPGNTELGVAWTNAFESEVAGLAHLETLGNLLRKRAGLDGPSAFEAWAANVATPPQSDTDGSKAPGTRVLALWRAFREQPKVVAEAILTPAPEIDTSKMTKEELMRE